jgi:hypothetical protein
MPVNRAFLYAGTFLLAIGGVLVAADLSGVDTARLVDVLRWWPLAVLAIGLGIVLRRSQAALPAGLFAAAIPGLVLGGALSLVPRVVGDCGVRQAAPPTSTQEGTFEGPTSVSVTTGCGSVSIATAPGSAWHLTAQNTAGQTPIVTAAAGSLSISSREHEGWGSFRGGRDTWDLTLPTSGLDDLSVVTYTGQSRVALPGAQIGRLAITANASQIDVDASTASVANLAGTVNVGSLSLNLPAGSDLLATLRIGGGELRLCAPTGLGLRVALNGQPRELTVADRHDDDSEWQSSDYATAAHHADLQVTTNFGAIKINPTGGCR